ncbi:MAG: sensory histidine kinase AtoS [Candidatus Methanofastidiosum methylothiophilum]|uniref:Sensory histidine kinase AtoS n=1 Tax=Candidatus Methanofastidiosum methylothiophilum TaxID=1705564 RepID=A0A150ITB8_9EURY|nr:MAG: sensory histidine kinase AtoS [Candidatus Methanofastidiosum methylthiophilus]KYC48162.1 MAG: sensory histidine kinase AtoS [Candidatus Methanofastidiosum methylthiophilus]KYC50817.1 MAG: sensory histidine kinase AtoS [Candidatus Methanofastidiosum methylthiophilus]
MDNSTNPPWNKNNFDDYISIFENINEAIFINTNEGIIFFVNNSMLELFGYSRDELIGMNITNIYANPKDRPNIIKILENNGLIKDFPVKLKKKNGEILDCEFNTKVKEDKNGNKIFFGFIRDTTERKKIENTIKESEEKLGLFLNLLRIS